MPCLVTSPRALILASAFAALSVVAGIVPATAATTYSVVATVPLGDGACPQAVSVNPSTHAAYVVDTNCGGHPIDGGAVWVIDETTNHTAGTLPLGEGRSPQGNPPRPEDVAVDPVRNIAYETVSNGQAQVSVVDAATDTLTATIPLSGAGNLAVDPATNTVYVTTASGVAVISGATDQITTTIPLSGAGSIAADPATGTVVVDTAASLTVISEATDQVTATIPLSSNAGALTVDTATATVYVATGAGAVAVISEATDQVTATSPLGFVPAGLAADPAADTVYASSNSSTNPGVSIIDGTTNQVSATVAIASGYFPTQLGVDPSTHTAYVSAALGELPPAGTVFVIGSNSGSGGGQAPIVTTATASGLAASGAILNGSVNPENQATSYRFDYGATLSYGSSVPAPAGSAGSGGSAVNEAASLTGLEPSHTYHFRIEASNATGTSYGADQTFTTAGLAPAVTTSAATAVTSSGATLNGSVNAEGQPTTYRFDYGTTTRYGSAMPSPAGSAGSGVDAFTESAALTGLRPGITYHFRIEATNATGTSYGPDRTFTTARHR
ncbi:MAG TPA: YncE family protein [Pseudonocardiaceae bacterium]|nr:YncE family protein [Pseudonocardiaceae bacterium]